MNTDSHTDQSVWDEVVFDAVRYAREHIITLPIELRATAFNMLVASLEHDVGRPPRSATSQTVRRYPRRNARRNNRY